MRQNADIIRELKRCGINDYRVGPHNNIIGELRNPECATSPYTVEWGNGYWMVRGLTPLMVAEKLYRDVVGKTDIRIHGNCLRPAPAEQAIWINPNNGKRIWDLLNKEECDRAAERDPGFRERLKDSEFMDDENRTINGVAYIESYHIDSELGLYIFVQMIKESTLTTVD